MQKVVDQLKNSIEQCKAKGEMFLMPHFDSKDVHVKKYAASHL